MYGEAIDRYCDKCKREVKINVSTCLIKPSKAKGIPGEEYYIGIYCPTCNSHLSKDTEEEVRGLKEAGVEFGVCML